MNKIKCPKCEELINEKSDFCESCGAEIKKLETKSVKEISTIHQKTPKSISPIVTSVITFLICLVAFGLFYKFYLSNLVIEKTRLEKNVTVTDVGIADAVEKIYDSVVIVNSYYNNNLASAGSGFVYKTDDKYAYILTNYHVISNATGVKVTFTNDETYEVDIIGSDEYTDIAVLKIDKDKIIAVAEIGNDKDLRVGDTTFAVGTPVDTKMYSWTVTRGILSGKNRLIEISLNNSKSSYVMEVLQTDTAINSGNSGGPLCNSNGEVVGITNMKLASTSIEGIGFAIPIDLAITYANILINKGIITRPYIGVAIRDYSSSAFATTSEAIIIEEIENNSPASKAGLKVGDKILKVNNIKVTSGAYFKYELYKNSPGDKITITYERDNKENTTTVTLGTYSDNA